MADRLTSNPIYKDQFDADSVLATKAQILIIKKIRWKSVKDGDIFQLEDALGNVIFEDIQIADGDWRDINFGRRGKIFSEGVTIDFSDCIGMAATDGTDAVYIYTK